MVEFDLPLVAKKKISKVSFDGNIVNVDAKLKQEYSEENLGKITKFECFKKSISLPLKIGVKKAIAKIPERKTRN